MALRGLPEKFILFDTEYTAWPGSVERMWSGPNEYREIIQVGGILVSRESMEETDHFTYYVRPVKNPQLSQYFIELTKITQHDVDTKGLLYTDALARFASWSCELPQEWLIPITEKKDVVQGQIDAFELIRGIDNIQDLQRQQWVNDPMLSGLRE